MTEANLSLDSYIPRDYQRCIFEAVEDKNFKRVMAIWPRRCLSGDTHITMANGSWKLLKDIVVGDKILSWNGSSFEPDIVKNSWKTGLKETLIVSGGRGYNNPFQGPEVICSEDHEFATVNYKDDFSWKKARDLSQYTAVALRYLPYLKKARVTHPNLYSKECPYLYKDSAKCLVSTRKGVPEELYDIETENNHNFVANSYVVHNSGKDITAWNLCIRELIRATKTIYYVFPTFASGRRILWDAITNDGFRILDYMPADLVESRNEQLMRIKLKNGSVFQVVGSDSYDTTLVGTNPQGVVFSEFALSDPMAYQFVRPILTANQGWVVIISTPRGKNHMYDMYQAAIQNPEDWFVSKLTVDDTKHISLESILKERAIGEMSEDLQLQEYWTSFSLGIEGGYYTKYIDRLRFNDQIGLVPWEPQYPVHTSWDIGVRDMTSIIFFQVAGQAIKVIDFYEKNKEGLEHYANILKEKPYTYGKHIGPHDIRNMEFSTGITRWEKARQLGITFEVADKISIMDGIEAVRTTLPRMYFDEKRCKILLKSLENYRQEYDSKKRTYKPQPLHDVYSNAADSMRYLAIYLPKLRIGLTPDDLERIRNEAQHGKKTNLPHFFR